MKAGNERRIDTKWYSEIEVKGAILPVGSFLGHKWKTSIFFNSSARERPQFGTLPLISLFTLAYALKSTFFLSKLTLRTIHPKLL